MLENTAIKQSHSLRGSENLNDPLNGSPKSGCSSVNGEGFGEEAQKLNSENEIDVLGDFKAQTVLFLQQMQ